MSYFFPLDDRFTFNTIVSNKHDFVTKVVITSKIQGGIMRLPK